MNLQTAQQCIRVSALVAETQRFQGRVVMVTGASRGIGRAMARAFAGEGAGVALVSSRAEGVRRVADEITAAGGRALPLEGDVSNEADVRRFVAQAERSLGPIDVLVNNAGIPGPTAPVTQIALADWQRVLAVNLTGVFLCAREVLKAMLAGRASPSPRATATGAIINIGSIAGKISYPQRTPYASAKWALVGLTLTLAEEVGPYGIRVNCICPGPVAGELIEDVMAARARATGLPLETVRQKFVGLTMLKRMVRPEDVAAAALFLASDAAENITGQALDVSGGIATLPG
jgi:NAD(P)-dependent dehydrogenase (short-subunit alcohol dehydrogenase family)